MIDTQKKESKKGASAAGAGGGTLLIVIANGLPEGNRLKPFLIWAAPSAAIFLGAIWLYFQYKVISYLNDREANVDFEKSKHLLHEALKNPLTSDEHRARLQKDLETLESITVGRYMARIKALRVNAYEPLPQASEDAKR